MKILMVLTSHDNSAIRAARPASGSKNSQPLTSFSAMPE